MATEYYHIHLKEGAISSHVYQNLSLNDLLLAFVCPYIKRDAVCVGSEIHSFTVYDSMKIFLTSKPIDSDFPIAKSDFIGNKTAEKDYFDNYKKAIEYEQALKKWLNENDINVTDKVYAEGLKYIDDGTYERYKKRFSSQEKLSFMIMPLENNEVRHNFDFVIRPAVEKYNYEINPIDKVEFTGEITNEILNQIVRSTFIVADLTDERPNCYYEVGYAQALLKPVIILAKEGTKRHFDISTENWIYWNDYKDLKGKFDNRLKKLVETLK